MEDLSVQHGIMGFDRASEGYAARRYLSRPLQFPVDLPGVVEAVGNRDEIEATPPRVREVLAPGLINLAKVDLLRTRTQLFFHLPEIPVGKFFRVGRARVPAVASKHHLCQEMCRMADAFTLVSTHNNVRKTRALPQ